MSAYLGAIVRKNDKTDHGGYVMTASSTMEFDGRCAALVGDLVSCPIEGHGVNPIIEGHPTMSENGRAVVVHECCAQCGCRVLASDPSLTAI
ncbi:PAAR domain-containing protein [Trinickia sp.]|uniref:PAAR domain-containing protein n=1 Tax=Trinickia sp. TaxID=2571163 RepID=UPI003F8175A1